MSSRRLELTRRDFLNGVALSVAAGLSPRELFAASPNPSGLTGLRGNHPGSFEAAHQLAREGLKPRRPREQTDELYDLIVIGGGLSGLAAAFLYQQREGGRVLVIDNHDDFGGHAKRNEFHVGGERLIGYGGSQSIDSPSAYSRGAKRLLRDIGIDTEPFYEYFDRGYFSRRGMRPGIHFRAADYGRDVVLPNVLGDHRGPADPAVMDSALDRYPLSAADREAFRALIHYDGDPLPSLSVRAKRERLRSMSYLDYLEELLDVPRDVRVILRDITKGYWGFGWDALSALEGWRLGMPGTAGLGIGGENGDDDGEPYIFHFPDGNAAIARALVRQLIPEAIGGRSMESLVLADVDYSLLDVVGAPTRLRLNTTALELRNTADGKAVDVTCTRAGRIERVRGRHAIMAGYLHMLPAMCPELEHAQRRAIDYAEKVPLVYISMAVRNWRAFAELGMHHIYVPQSPLMHAFGLDFPVSIGDYEFTRNPAEPAVLHGSFAPTVPDKGLSQREQNRAGRARLYDMRFADYEQLIVEQLDGALRGGGFDVERDLAAITVNRWPHGYAYEYNELYDPPEYNSQNGPHLLARQPLGRISMANSDSQAHAYVDGAFDAAIRAVREQFG